MEEISFGKLRILPSGNHAPDREFDILVDGVAVGTAVLIGDDPQSKYYTLSVRIGAEEHDFDHEWSSSAGSTQWMIRKELSVLLTSIHESNRDELRQWIRTLRDEMAAAEHMMIKAELALDDKELVAESLTDFRTWQITKTTLQELMEQGDL